jgi:ubiquinone/menaquinone biosynthesis C-methylase UbiE
MTTDTMRVAEKYDDAMYADGVKELWEHSDFCNFGYWRPGTTDHRQACEDLVDELLALVPSMPTLILDVACGLGATTGHIALRYPKSQVVGINISRKQLASAKLKRPNCKFIQMDAVTLAFPSNSFDSIVCVEAAFHFDTRQRFLSEAYRILKPGGSLVLSDILAKKWVSRVRSSATVRNMTMNLEAYRKAYATSGFMNLQIVDVTTEVLTRLCRHHRRWGLAKLRQSADVRPIIRLMLFDLVLLAGARHYLLVTAKKP